MSSRLAILGFAAVSAWGQVNWLAPRTISANFDAVPVGHDTMTDDEFFNQNTFETRQSPPATVSAEQLRHPVSRKGIKLILQAKTYSRSGKHDKAIEQLVLALQEPSAVPYAHSLLGAEYLFTQQFPAAVPELEEAVRLLPHEVANHSNLGYALYLVGEKERGQQEVRVALSLDPRNRQTRFVMGLVEQPLPAEK